MKNYGIAIPTFNRQTQLENLLLSIPISVPVFISDNGGCLPEVFKTKYINSTIKKLSPAIAMFKNWNSAAKLTTTEWIAITSDDDIYYKESFSTIDFYIEKYNHMDMIIFGHNTIDTNGNIIRRWQPKLETCLAPAGFVKFKYGVDARMPSIFIKKRIFDELNGFYENFNITAADSDFIQRAALISNVQFIPEIVSGYRVWEGGLTFSKIGSIEWMEEIDQWCERLKLFCEVKNIPAYSSKISAEIYARNLVAGISVSKKTSGYKGAWKHFQRCRYPFNSHLYTQLKLLYWLIKP